MAVYSYRLANGQTRWFFIIDLPPDANGRRRQHKRQGFPNQTAALRAEEQARAAYGGADLGADGSVAAELESWLNERELDVQETTLSNYRDVIRCYVVPHIGGRQLYALDKRVIHDLYKMLLKGGGKNGGPLSPTTVRIVTSGHSDYWRPNSQVLNSQAAVIIGDYDAVALEHGEAP